MSDLTFGKLRRIFKQADIQAYEAEEHGFITKELADVSDFLRSPLLEEFKAVDELVLAWAYYNSAQSYGEEHLFSLFGCIRDVIIIPEKEEFSIGIEQAREMARNAVPIAREDAERRYKEYAKKSAALERKFKRGFCDSLRRLFGQGYIEIFVDYRNDPHWFISLTITQLGYQKMIELGYSMEVLSLCTRDMSKFHRSGIYARFVPQEIPDDMKRTGWLGDG